MTNFPPADTRRHAWRPFIMTAMTWLSDVGDGNVKFNAIVNYIESMPGFPGWATWGDYNGKPNQMGRRFLSLEATAMKKDGLLVSPRRGTYRLASETPEADAPEAPVVEPTVVHKAILAVVPDPEPEVKAPEPVKEAPVAEGPTTHPAYLANERARRVAIEQTRCFGFYSERAPNCSECPLAGLCFAARGGKVAEAASRVADADAVADRAAEIMAERLNKVGITSRVVQCRGGKDPGEVAAAEIKEAAEDAAPAPAPINIPASAERSVVKLPWPVVCSACGELTPENEEVTTIEGFGTFHHACVPSAV